MRRIRKEKIGRTGGQKIIKGRRRSWTTIRRYITQEEMRKNTADKNNKEKYEKGVNVNRKEINRSVIRPQRRRETHGRNNRIRGRKIFCSKSALWA